MSAINGSDNSESCNSDGSVGKPISVEDLIDIDDTEGLVTPGDGYRVEAYDYADGHIVLNMYVKSEGERLWNHEIARWSEATPRSRGHRAKLYWLWAAFCHYLNSGGGGPAGGALLSVAVAVIALGGAGWYARRRLR